MPLIASAAGGFRGMKQGLARSYRGDHCKQPIGRTRGQTRLPFDPIVARKESRPVLIGAAYPNLWPQSCPRFANARFAATTLSEVLPGDKSLLAVRAVAPKSPLPFACARQNDRHTRSLAAAFVAEQFETVPVGRATPREATAPPLDRPAGGDLPV